MNDVILIDKCLAAEHLSVSLFYQVEQSISNKTVS